MNSFKYIITLVLFCKITILYAQDVSSFLKKGNKYFLDSNYSMAVDLYKKALVSSPENSIIFNNLGTACYKLGKLDEAISCFKKNLEAEKGVQEKARANYNLGVVYIKNNQFEDALNSFKAAVILTPSNVLYKQNLQMVINYLKEKKNADNLKSDEKQRKSEAKPTQNGSNNRQTVNPKSSSTGEELLMDLKKQENLLKSKLKKGRKKTTPSTIIGW